MVILFELPHDQLLKRIHILHSLGHWFDNFPGRPALRSNLLECQKALCIVAGYPCPTQTVTVNGVNCEILVPMSEADRYMNLSAPMEGIQALAPFNAKRRLSTPSKKQLYVDDAERVNSPPNKKCKTCTDEERANSPPNTGERIEEYRRRGLLAGLSPASAELAAEAAAVHESAMEHARTQVYSSGSTSTSRFD